MNNARTSPSLFAAAVASAALLLTGSAHAQSADETFDPAPLAGPATPPAVVALPNANAPDTVEKTPRANATWAISAGFRVAYVTSPGFDPFAKNDVLSSLDLEVTRTILVRDRFSLATGVEGTMGARADTARGSKSSLYAGKVAIPFEARYHAARWVYFDARVAPALTIASAALAPDATDAFALLGADASLGARLGVPLGPSSTTARLWFGTDLGYSLTTSHEVRVSSASDIPGTTQHEIALGKLSLSGAFFRGNVGVAF